MARPRSVAPAAEPGDDPGAALLAAIERWRQANAAYEFASAEMKEARIAVVAALKALGVEGFSL